MAPKLWSTDDLTQGQITLDHNNIQLKEIRKNL